MNEKIDLKDFDIIGIISLNDVYGIEKYLTPVRIDDKIVTYLSRSKEYYNVKSMTELALEREELKNKLTRELTKMNTDSKNGPQQVTNPISKKIIESIIKNMEQLVKEQDVLVTENTFQ